MKAAWRKNRLVPKKWVAVVSKASARHGPADRWRWSLYYCPEGSHFVDSKHLHSIGRATKQKLARGVVEAVLTQLQPGWRRSG